MRAVDKDIGWLIIYLILVSVHNLIFAISSRMDLFVASGIRSITTAMMVFFLEPHIICYNDLNPWNKCKRIVKLIITAVVLYTFLLLNRVRTFVPKIKKY